MRASCILAHEFNSAGFNLYGSRVGGGGPCPLATGRRSRDREATAPTWPWRSSGTALPRQVRFGVFYSNASRIPPGQINVLRASRRAMNGSCHAGRGSCPNKFMLCAFGRAGAGICDVCSRDKHHRGINKYLCDVCPDTHHKDTPYIPL